MCIVTPSAAARHPAPRAILPIAGARSIGDGFFEIAVQPGAVAADVVAALEAIPYDAAFVEVFDDLDTILVFQHSYPDAPAARRARPAAPTPPQPELAAAAG
jgi:uncharacterized repeat protein (TIGR03917 family)